MLRETATTQADVSSGALVECDIPCAVCGYNLRSLETVAVCTECGTRITTSLDRSRLIFADPDWIDSVIRSMLLTVFSIALCYGVLQAYAIQFLSFAHPFVHIAPGWGPIARALNIAGPVLSIGVWIGVWRSTGPRPDIPWMFYSRHVRNTATITVVAFCAVSIVFRNAEAFWKNLGFKAIVLAVMTIYYQMYFLGLLASIPLRTRCKRLWLLLVVEMLLLFGFAASCEIIDVRGWSMTPMLLQDAPVNTAAYAALCAAIVLGFIIHGLWTTSTIARRIVSQQQTRLSAV